MIVFIGFCQLLNEPMPLTLQRPTGQQWIDDDDERRPQNQHPQPNVNQVPLPPPDDNDDANQ